MVTFKVRSSRAMAISADGQDAAEAPPTSAAATADARARVVLVAFAIVIAFWIVITAVGDPEVFKARAKGGPSPVEGLTIFAVFFVAAQAVERLLEPLTHLVPRPDPATEAASADKAEAAFVSACEAYEKLVSSASTEEHATNTKPLKMANAQAQTALDAAAKAKAASEVRKGELSIGTWAVATVVGMTASVSLHLYLLRTVGIAEPSYALEILATGLIIGAGTKPLHELVKLIEKKKESAEKAANAA